MADTTAEVRPCGCVYEGEQCVKPCPDQNVPAIIGRKPCGCVVAAMVVADALDPDEMTDNARELREWKRAGITPEQQTVGFVRHGGLQRCPHGRKKPGVRA